MKEKIEEITIDEMVRKLKLDDTSQVKIAEIWKNIINFPKEKQRLEFLVAIHQNTPEDILVELANSPRQIIKFYLKKRQDLSEKLKRILWPPKPLKKQNKGVEVSY